ncbi:peptide-N-glycosidase F-like protein [Bacteroides zoogleoformans]|uniref:N-glycanase n=1 Tax=Bacteroides zoogleoformans TaxID=28119 RepID=A0ABM6TBA9_9BACE|nr:PNGase F N-terminal domain-containing protein [Bacteroides zoogleoformans]AVM54047.1 N-glycanase [Bacteroides zoogleoformans]TWJ18417.1 peptide-N-glycosidase F-like protein [Bacteroides zoogleoformans]
MNKITCLLLSLFLLSSALSVSAKKHPAMGDLTLRVFDKTPVCFRPDTLKGYNEPDADGVIRLVNGRIILKKIHLPSYRRNVRVAATVSVESNGDRWDKTGSCFVLPKESVINMLGVARDEQHYPETDTARVELFKGIVSGAGYFPAIELMRFMTPFGVGFYSGGDDEKASLRRPVYIDGWAPRAEWTQDVTDRFSSLEGEAYVGIFIDTWTAEGYVASLTLEVKESAIPEDALLRTRVLPLINTVPYVGQSLPDLFARRSVTVDAEVPAKAKNLRLQYIATGHGGHSGGDEFTQQLNIVRVDGDTVIHFVPWRTDCASFRRFNPTSGVWLVKRKAAYIGEKGYETKEIEEALASSDLSRSNWCPGSDVWPVAACLKHLKPGSHIFAFSIPNAQPAKGEELNHWLISAYLVWEE